MATIKNSLQRVLSRYKPLYSLLDGLIIWFLLRRAKDKIGEPANRHLRVRVLRHGIDKLKNAMQSINYKQGLLLANGEEYAFSDGILLNLKGTNRYLKVFGDDNGNEGKQILNFLKTKHIAVNTAIDLGANFGEISIYLSQQNPAAKVLAVEASADNYKILKANCGFQNFSTKNIILLNEAVSDKKGFMEITKGISAENIVINAANKKAVAQGAKTETVPADTLTSFMQRFGFAGLDFLKVDIEGSEPLLYGALEQCRGRIKAILLEVGDKADHKDYLPLLELLWNSGMDCYDRLSEIKFATWEELKAEVLSSFVSDLWFISNPNR